MNKRLAGVLFFAFVVAAGASYALYWFIGARLAESQQEPSGQIIVAARTLEIGTMIQDLDLKTTEWAGTVPASAITETENIVGRGVLTTIYAGEPILEERLAPVGAGAGLAATIPVGMRAVAIRVNDVVGVAGFVIPGMRVDVLIMGNPPNNPRSLGTLSKTLLQNIEVLSAGQEIQQDREGKPVRVPVVNLLVDPEQAEILSLAANQASIQLVLRNPLDKDVAKTRGSAIALLFTDQKSLPASAPRRTGGTRRAPRQFPPPIVPPKPEPVVVEILHGAKKTQVKFATEEEVAEER